ncbi:MAG TPA: alpha/beta hydrolase [Dehalococcoidia bacterium]|nr:alpha/beta hydrolase [Dehalococcoidia bacterium]
MAAPDTGRVTIEYDVVVGRAGNRGLRANVYMPPQPGPGRPALLLVHGGGWVSGDRSQLHGYGILIGRLGYVCVATEYRLAGEAPWPAQLHDVKTALRWMRANAATLGIDPAKIAVSGNSAGAHLSLMLAGTPNVPSFEGDGGHAGISTDVAASIAFYGPAQLYEPGQPLSRELEFLFGKGYSEETARAASPVTYAAAAFPPTLLITGNKDELVPVESSFRMYRALTSAGAAAELHVYEGAPHAFDAEPRYGRQCASIMALFLDRHVRNPSASNAAASADTPSAVEAGGGAAGRAAS